MIEIILRKCGWAGTRPVIAPAGPGRYIGSSQCLAPRQRLFEHAKQFSRRSQSAKRFRHRAGRTAAPRARIRRAHHAGASSCLLAGFDAHRQRFRSACAGFGETADSGKWQTRATRDRDRVERPRPIRVRQESRKTTMWWSSSATSSRSLSALGIGQAVFCRQLARRHPHHAARGDASSRHRRRCCCLRPCRAGDRSRRGSHASKVMSASCRSRTTSPRARKSFAACSAPNSPN